MTSNWLESDLYQNIYPKPKNIFRCDLTVCCKKSKKVTHVNFRNLEIDRINFLKVVPIHFCNHWYALAHVNTTRIYKQSNSQYLLVSMAIDSLEDTIYLSPNWICWFNSDYSLNLMSWSYPSTIVNSYLNWITVEGFVKK